MLGVILRSLYSVNLVNNITGYDLDSELKVDVGIFPEFLVNMTLPQEYSLGNSSFCVHF